MFVIQKCFKAIIDNVLKVTFTFENINLLQPKPTPIWANPETYMWQYMNHANFVGGW